jgi:DnaJ-class molecular chaperone
MAKREPDCMPCRGTGKVISNLGGESRQVPCPWCEGSGVRTSGIDAQAAWQEGGGAGGEDGKA